MEIKVALSKDLKSKQKTRKEKLKINGRKILGYSYPYRGRGFIIFDFIIKAGFESLKSATGPKWFRSHASEIFEDLESWSYWGTDAFSEGMIHELVHCSLKPQECDCCEECYEEIIERLVETMLDEAQIINVVDLK